MKPQLRRSAVRARIRRGATPEEALAWRVLTRAECGRLAIPRRVPLGPHVPADVACDEPVVRVRVMVPRRAADRAA